MTRSLVLASVFFCLTSASRLCAQKEPIRISVDLTDGPRKLLHSDMDIPTQPGPLTLTELKWIPGHHTPVGPVQDIVDVVFTANGKVLPWKRDDLDLFEYHLSVPQGVHSIHAHLDCIETRRNVSNVVTLQWEKVTLLPAGVKFRDQMLEASVTVPAGWAMASALRPAEPYDVNHPNRQTVRYKPVTAETLQDSPLFSGQYAHEYALALEVTPKHYLDVFAPKKEEVDVRPKVIDELSKLVRETGALYKSRHYNSYHFLLTLTKNAGGGTEHHESSDNGMTEDGLATDAVLGLNGGLLPHEFTHSWNGKFRRPDGEIVENFSEPMKSGLLWVYEGLTDYLGNVLAVRCGLESADTYKQALGLEAAQLDTEPGRQWRSTEDTAVSVTAFRTSTFWASTGPAWTSWRRSSDYYQEGELLWLEADTTIRKLTNNRKSINDFLAMFLGAKRNTGPMVVPYDLEEIESLLQKVAPYDWKNFFEKRVYEIEPRADLTGIEQAGYRLVYQDQPSAYETLLTAHRGLGPDVWFSLGMTLSKDGTIGDIQRGGVADRARLAPGEKVVAIGGAPFSSEAMISALAASRTSNQPIQISVQDDLSVRAVDLDYNGGLRYPTLVRADAGTDYLKDILAPLTTATGQP